MRFEYLIIVARTYLVKATPSNGYSCAKANIIFSCNAGVDHGAKSRKRKRAPFESEADKARIDRWQRLRKMDSSKQLKRMMGKEAEFRGVQKAAIEAIVAGESPVVAVMPTGGGKSLLVIFNVKDTLLADECHSSHIALLLGFKYQNFISLDLYSLEISSMCIDIGTY